MCTTLKYPLVQLAVAINPTDEPLWTETFRPATMVLLLPRRALARCATTAITKSQPRRFQKTAAAGGGASAAGGAEEEPPKYKPGFFSRNPGVTLGGIVLAIGLYVYRSSRNKKNFESVQTPIAEVAVISPYEAWELRSSNEITCVGAVSGLVV